MSRVYAVRFSHGSGHSVMFLVTTVLLRWCHHAISAFASIASVFAIGLETMEPEQNLCGGNGLRSWFVLVRDGIRLPIGVRGCFCWGRTGSDGVRAMTLETEEFERCVLGQSTRRAALWFWTKVRAIVPFGRHRIHRHELHSTLFSQPATTKYRQSGNLHVFTCFISGTVNSPHPSGRPAPNR